MYTYVYVADFSQKSVSYKPVLWHLLTDTNLPATSIQKSAIAAGKVVFRLNYWHIIMIMSWLLSHTCVIQVDAYQYTLQMLIVPGLWLGHVMSLSHVCNPMYHAWIWWTCLLLSNGIQWFYRCLCPFTMLTWWKVEELIIWFLLRNCLICEFPCFAVAERQMEEQEEGRVVHPPASLYRGLDCNDNAHIQQQHTLIDANNVSTLSYNHGNTECICFACLHVTSFWGFRSIVTMVTKKLIISDIHFKYM